MSSAAQTLLQQRAGPQAPACSTHSSRRAPRVFSRAAPVRCRRAITIQCAAATGQEADNMKTIVQKTTPGEMPFPWSEKDPYRLPVSIDRVQKLLVTLGWEKAWVEQIIDRVMKGMLKTTEERAQGVIEFLATIGLQQDEICNMASISVVLLGLNPSTRLRPVVEYLVGRGVAAESVADLVLRHPRIFEYKVSGDGRTLQKGAARIQVDVLPLPNGTTATAVNYFREGASFTGSPVAPMPPMP